MTGQELVDAVKDGWFPVGDGWKPLVLELNDRLLALNPDYAIDQIKEKFGGLRYYAHGFDPCIEDDPVVGLDNVGYELITEAEEASFNICESCGKPGELRTGGWLKTLCDECTKGRTNESPY